MPLPAGEGPAADWDAKLFTRPRRAWDEVATMEIATRNRVLFYTLVALATLLVAAGAAVAGDPPPGLCFCIDVNGHCISFC